MPLNSLYKNGTYVLNMRRQNADPNKGVAFRYNFIAAYPKSVKSSLQFTHMKNLKLT